MKYKNNIIVGILIMLAILVFNRNNKKDDLLGVYIDGAYSNNIPSKDAGYVVEKIVCDNNANGKWDYNKLGILVDNLSNKSKCNIYFKRGVRFANKNVYLDTSDKCPTINSDETINVTASENENSLLCSAPDNYGTSYYYRGNVVDNYVKFGGFYWRIVRINGDGSIRLIYDGKTAHANGKSSNDRVIGSSAFNEKDDDNAYVGYMYGTPGSSTYAKTHANTNDSTIKKYLDNWYKNNILNQSFEKNIADSSFCNYRKIMSGKGYAKEKTAYFGYWGNHALYCEKNDAFTVGDSGNGALTYSIGLLTRSEAILAGGYKNGSSDYYLYDGNGTWLMTPVDAFNDYQKARVNDLTSSGSPYGTGCSTTTCVLNVKPVINLKPNSLISGDGTINNPYQVE